MIVLAALPLLVALATVIYVLLDHRRRVEEYVVIRDSLVNSTNDFQVFRDAFSSTALVASGGLCAPLSPLYTMPAYTAGKAIRESLPNFGVTRGGIEITVESDG